MQPAYDAILIVGFGGPEGREDVIPFLENVLRGRNVPRERMLEVAEHYYHFDGISPLNQQVRDLIAALEPELREHEIALPIYWGNRNWHPLLPDTLRQMADDGIQHALAIVLAAYSSYSSCRQYRENIEAAREAVGEAATQVDKVRVWYNHPDFIAANVDRVRRTIIRAGSRIENGEWRMENGPEMMPDGPSSPLRTWHVAFTAHSIPQSMADQCDYQRQLTETCRLIAEALGITEDRWQLVYQSRSGRPQDPWLEPDICDHLRELNPRGVSQVIVHPVGFLSDHMEVLYDLDNEAARVASEIGLRMVRSQTVGTHPDFVRMLHKLIAERLHSEIAKEAIGAFPAGHDVCPVDCCPAPARRRQPSP